MPAPYDDDILEMVKADICRGTIEGTAGLHRPNGRCRFWVESGDDVFRPDIGVCYRFAHGRTYGFGMCSLAYRYVELLQMQKAALSEESHAELV